MKRDIPEYEVDANLRAWAGGHAKIWFYYTSHRSIALRLVRDNPLEVLYVFGVGCDRIKGPFSWPNSSLKIEKLSPSSQFEPACRIFDNDAGFELFCSGATLVKASGDDLRVALEQFSGVSLPRRPELI